MGKKKFKEYIVYICNICKKNFGNKKDHYDMHKNRKTSCVKKSNNELQNPPQVLQNSPIKKVQELSQEIINEDFDNNYNIEEIPLCVEINNIDENNVEDNKVLFPCEYCHKLFAKKFNLTRHLNGRCKEKKIKNNEFAIVNEIKEQLNVLIKQNEELKKDNKKIKKELNAKKKNKSNVNIINNNNIVNNIVNNNQRIVNFNNMNLEEVDKKLFIQPMINGNYQGKQILLKTIENIYINEEHPEYHNLIITDKNRGYVKVFNNGKWKTDNIKLINNVIDGIVFQSKNILIELKQQYVGNNRAMDRLNTSEKYVNLCDLEYLEDLKDAQENDGVNNIALINRCKEFRDMVYDDTINLFHDNKKTLLKTQKNNDKIIEI